MSWAPDSGKAAFPIEFDRVPPRTRFLYELREIVEQFPLMVSMGAGDRAVSTMVDKTARFLEGLLSGRVVLDDEGYLRLADDQGAISDVIGGDVQCRLREEAALASVERTLNLLRKRLGVDLPVVDTELLPVDYNLGHKNSPSVDAVRTGHGSDVLKSTVGDTTDADADSFAAASVGGSQDGAAVPPIAAAPRPGGDMASPNKSMSPPPIL